ncbi:MAG: ubiquinone-binding protein [Cobetia sp.]|jgi:ribosome-associated toxin RatA of RatAB toxin-antitoxin module|uniref:Type II toxin-antitoxin system RatA family toxin n=1 Tax=Cobetia amphilecti TaxID=1055104 RepID=A0AAP4TXM5_9GAMM|nr:MULTISPECIES: type II toxin-antitoxin system RatA family toxin [Cobetia]AVV34020.1 type II toxin-antitoxin system RatA family toxin [Halomonas sp. SF2003]MBR9754978.1 type II toxin-antitoxin system RatA family toxin [Gammaproteobacteria bacterium]NVN54347.1 type II toxin-antitoxin system RatA family toxin [bacterium Scap17]TCJ24628.1 type II toxin-antitoxin system RatA family toxin [Halomonas sp. GDM18]KGA02397.1 cyclase [Cobetia amphilecti]|tara:strand:- start:268 stop:705 length:438 start_codon:yes stop_codon:yes gene_type:complete
MPTVNRSALVRHSARAMFDLVNDFERYPEFLSGCSNAELLERDEDHLKGRLTLSKAGMQQSFVTRNDLYAPERIELNLVDGPFKRLQGTWLFTPLGEDACKVSLEMDFEFSNRLLGMAFGKLFSQVAAQMVEAFTRRADQIYTQR